MPVFFVVSLVIGLGVYLSCVRRWQTMKFRILQMDRYEARIVLMRLYGRSLLFRGLSFYVLALFLLSYFLRHWR